MPSYTSILSSALGALLLSSPALAFSEQCSTFEYPLSCHNKSAVANTCCFNYPGGLLLQTQFWDTDPATGPADHWTVHGLWPDECNGSYQQYCDESRQYKNITQILEHFNRYDLLDYMSVYWKDDGGNDESFWEHEWGKHGTCISTFDTSCYTDYVPTQEVVDFFQKTLQLFSVLDTYTFLKDAGIVPSTTKTYTYSEIRKALVQDRHVNATIECTGANSTELDEVYYYYNVYGSAQDGTYIPAQPDTNSSSCPMTGIQYLPKNLTSTPKQNGTYKFL
ncbi:hypothetical protein HO173_010617 [Letharia columbiana]|nr:uncharacterized protein HO173_010617 [Letharia columbiana]KAF6231117.1 hypothetical protein HO173_010617 [Letharia columbiana]